MRRKYLLLFILLIIAFRVFAFDSIPVSFVKQDFHYKTDYASEVYLVWIVNDWQLPASDEIPKNAFIRNGMVYSLMEAHDDSFYVSLAVKENTLIHFYFLLSKDKSNKPSENWDTYYNSNYSLIVKKCKIFDSEQKLYSMLHQ